MKIKNKCSKCKKIKQIQNVKINLISNYLLIKIPTQINKNNKTIRFKTRINIIDENNIKLSNYSFILKEAIQGYVDDPRNTDNAWMVSLLLIAQMKII